MSLLASIGAPPTIGFCEAVSVLAIAALAFAFDIDVLAFIAVLARLELEFAVFDTAGAPQPIKNADAAVSPASAIVLFIVYLPKVENYSSDPAARFISRRSSPATSIFPAVRDVVFGQSGRLDSELDQQCGDKQKNRHRDDDGFF
jgi:hypothetical protein